MDKLEEYNYLGYKLIIKYKRVPLNMKHYNAFLKRAAGKGVLQKFRDYFDPPAVKVKKEKVKARRQTKK